MVADSNIDRLLFLLHGSILETLSSSQSEADRQKKDLSWLGLDTVCRMTLDVVHSHRDARIPPMPICCYYSVHAARKCLQERNKLVMDEALSHNIDILWSAEEQYCNVWVF